MTGDRNKRGERPAVIDRTIPPMKHSPHADDCPAVGGRGGWRPAPGRCNCGRFYPSMPTAAARAASPRDPEAP